MKIRLISWTNCVRCRFLEWPLQSRAEKNGYELEEVNINEASPEDIEGETMLPIIIWDGKHISYEETLQKITQ